MADLKLNNTLKKVTGQLTIVGSKSLSNRLLILQKIYQKLEIKNLANAHDTQVLIKALKSKDAIIDIGHAGTAMRFLTAFFATQGGMEVLLTGSSRMQERPIAILVDALRELGADISYQKKEGYPPLLIKGKKITKNKVQIDGSVSSQYISALLLIAPNLENGLVIELKGKITSLPYINMTLSLLNEIGVSYTFDNNIIKIEPLIDALPKTLTIESDWSAVSYFYSLIALSKNGRLQLKSFKKESLQGDKVLIDIYAELGVKTVFNGDTLHLSKAGEIAKHLDLDLKNAPDIAQTIAVTCFGLGISCDLKGLHTLKIKETDRLQALKTELEKLGAQVIITADSFHLEKASKINKNIMIATYQDHRMAMAFAPLSLLIPISVETFDVVKKSYPFFWLDFDTVLKS
jgi:3-phosphoshikimate 1-carboxyvinyltransferase